MSVKTIYQFQILQNLFNFCHQIFSVLISKNNFEDQNHQPRFSNIFIVCLAHCQFYKNVSHKSENCFRKSTKFFLEIEHQNFKKL